MAKRSLFCRNRDLQKQRGPKRVTTERARNSCDFKLVFDSGRSRCPSDLSKSAQLWLPKNVEISSDYKFRTKTAKYRALEKNALRERISGLGASLRVQRFAD